MSVRFRFPELWIKSRIDRARFASSLMAFLSTKKLYSAVTSIEVHKTYLKARLNDKTEVTLRVNASPLTREPDKMIVYNPFFDKRSEITVPKEETVSISEHFRILQ